MKILPYEHVYFKNNCMGLASKYLVVIASFFSILLLKAPIAICK